VKTKVANLDFIISVNLLSFGNGGPLSELSRPSCFLRRAGRARNRSEAFRDLVWKFEAPLNKSRLVGTPTFGANKHIASD